MLWLQMATERCFYVAQRFLLSHREHPTGNFFVATERSFGSYLRVFWGSFRGQKSLVLLALHLSPSGFCHSRKNTVNTKHLLLVVRALIPGPPYRSLRIYQAANTYVPRITEDPTTRRYTEKKNDGLELGHGDHGHGGPPTAAIDTHRLFELVQFVLGLTKHVAALRLSYVNLPTCSYF